MFWPGFAAANLIHKPKKAAGGAGHGAIGDGDAVVAEPGHGGDGPPPGGGGAAIVEELEAALVHHPGDGDDVDEQQPPAQEDDGDDWVQALNDALERAGGVHHEEDHAC